TQASALAGHVLLDLVDGVWGEVREAAVLEVAPQQLHGVEVGRVGRKPDDLPARMCGQPCAHELVLVRVAAIPHEDDGTPHLAREFFLPGPSLAGPTRAHGDRRAPSRAAGGAAD